MLLVEDRKMNVKGLKSLRKELDVFLTEFDGCIKTGASREHLRTYVSGQLSDLERKSIEPIALEAGVPPRSLQEFLGLHRWDHVGVRRRVGERVMEHHADPNAIALVDETSTAKKGDETAGVQRQYCGSTGKIDNCVVTVHLGYAAGDFQALVDGDLYIPEETWAANPERRRKVGIPDSVVYRPKWQIALDILDRSAANGVRFKYLTADETYGKVGAFREGVDQRGLLYVVEVPCSLCGWTTRPGVIGPAKAQGTNGRPRTRTRLDASAPPARRVDALVSRKRPAWKTFHIKNTEKGPVVWAAKATRFSPWSDGLPGDEVWLVMARNALDGEVKFFLSNAPRTVPIPVLLHVAFSRARIERLFEDSKGEVGLDHFEVRHYLSIQRHLILSMVSLLFLAEQTQRLRKKKLGMESGPGAGSRRSPARSRTSGGGADPPTGGCAGQNPILAAHGTRGRTVPQKGTIS